MREIANFIFEAGTLKYVRRSGWWVLNLNDPESVADHVFRATLIGYFLAKLEKADSDKVVKMCLFHDLHESRINDVHKVGKRYIDLMDAERKSSKEQTDQLGDIGKEIFELNEEIQEQSSKEASIAKDADYLENAAQAKEYLEIGYKDAQTWIDSIRKLLKTDSAKKLLKEIEATSSNDWWKSLKKIQG